MINVESWDDAKFSMFEEVQNQDIEEVKCWKILIIKSLLNKILISVESKNWEVKLLINLESSIIARFWIFKQVENQNIREIRLLKNFDNLKLKNNKILINGENENIEKLDYKKYWNWTIVELNCS